MIFLPLSCFTILISVIYRSSSQYGLRESFLRASVVFGMLIFLSCEIFSLFQAINWQNFVIFWLLTFLLLLLILLKQSSRPLPIVAPLSLLEKGMCLGVFLILTQASPPFQGLPQPGLTYVSPPGLF